VLRGQTGVDLAATLPIDLYGHPIDDDQVFAAIVDRLIPLSAACTWLPLDTVLDRTPIAEADVDAVIDAADLFHLH